MKHLSMITALATILGALDCLPQTQTDIFEGITTYVWDFTTRRGEINDITTRFTDDFEEALTQSKVCIVLERRNYSMLFSQENNENGILNIKNIPQQELENLKKLKANSVVFGEIIDDIGSQPLLVTIKVQKFDSQILAKASIPIDRDKIFDADIRKKKVAELLEKLRFGKSENFEEASKSATPNYNEATLAYKTSILQQLIEQYFRISAPQEDEWVLTFVSESQLGYDISNQQYQLIAIDGGDAEFMAVNNLLSNSLNNYQRQLWISIDDIAVLHGPNGTGWKNGSVINDQVSKQLRIIEAQERLDEIKELLKSYSNSKIINHFFDGAIIGVTLFDLRKNDPPTWRQVVDYAFLAGASYRVIEEIFWGGNAEVRALKAEKKALELELKNHSK